MNIYLSTNLYIYLSIYKSIYLSIYLSIYQSRAAGDKVRELKAAKADKASVDAAVKSLLELKGQFKAETGSDWKPAEQPKKAGVRVYLSIYLFIYLAIYLFIYLSIYLFIYLSSYLYLESWGATQKGRVPCFSIHLPNFLSGTLWVEPPKKGVCF